MKQLIVCLLGTIILSQNIHAHNLADVIETVLPAITYIEVERHATKTIIDSTSKSIIKRKEKLTSTVGTGFIIENNKVVTNHHVVEDAILAGEKIYVTFDKNNGVRYEATVIGYDEVADVALLQIAGNHPSLEIDLRAADLRMGESIFTISNYFSIRHSATQGIVSSNDRADRRFPYIKLLQLQILQGSGSSGGPVLNQEGKVVALNHAVLSMIPNNVYKSSRPSLLSMTAFTIRGDQLARSIAHIKASGVVRRADLGLYLQNYGVKTERYQHNPIENSHSLVGVVVSGIDMPGPRGKIRANDIILSVDEQRFTNGARLLLWLDENKEIGDIVKLQVYRDGALLNITIDVIAARRYR